MRVPRRQPGLCAMRLEIAYFQRQFWLLPVLSVAYGASVRYPYKYAACVGLFSWALILRWGDRS